MRHYQAWTQEQKYFTRYGHTLKEDLASFLNIIDFDMFATFTTRKPISLGSARRIAEKVGRFLDAGTHSDFFWCAEPFELKEGAGSRYHFHALIKSELTPMTIWSWYYPRYGRCQIIENPAERREAAAHYLAKYVTKDIADYDLNLKPITYERISKNS